MGLKDAVRTIVTGDGLVPLWRALAGNLVTVQMLHRFADPDLGVRGTSIADLRANLEFVRRHRIAVTSLAELLAPSPSARPPKGPSVVFTVDDGYADFARIAAPVFAEFDCPVTVFLVTGALDGACWYWWDRVEFAIESTTRSGVELDLFGQPASWRWDTPLDRARAIEQLVEALKLLPNAQKDLTIATLAERLEVDVPIVPPPRYGAMSWNDVRRCATMGATFGPHTVTHPILPAVGDAEARWEILESWQRLRSECDAVVPVFAYPGGMHSVREVSILSESGIVAAVTTHQRYAPRAAFHDANPRTRFTLPRFAYTDTRDEFVQVVTGVERLKLAVRGD